MSASDARAAVEAAYRTERRRVLSTLIRFLGDFDTAEEALHDAFATAARQWPEAGVPSNPYAWLVSTGRFKAVDRWRRTARIAAALPELAALASVDDALADPDQIRDDELRLFFTCCHPALPPDSRIALTLREVGGLTTEEIARAFVTRTSTIAQRIVRAKAKIREEAIPYAVPSLEELPERMGSVLTCLYLVFNEGYVATEGPDLIRSSLCSDAIRLVRLAVDLLEDPEALGLLALMLLHEARRAARVDAAGDLVLLEDQDRSLWNAARVAEARQLVERAHARRTVGPYLIQAMIALAHAEAPGLEQTNWTLIVGLYEVLLQLDPSPIVELNRAVALGMRDGPDAALERVERALTQIQSYAPAHAAHADFLRRVGRLEEAKAAYERALELTQQPAERRFFEKRLSTFDPPR